MELVGQAWALVSVWQREILAALSSVRRAGAKSAESGVSGAGG